MDIDLDKLNEATARVTEAATRLGEAFAEAGKSLEAACHVLNAAQLARDEAFIRAVLASRERRAVSAASETDGAV